MDYTIVDNWVTLYQQVWRGERGVSLTDLFSDDVQYRTSPYAEPIKGFTAVEKFWNDAVQAGEVFTMTHELVALEGDIAVIRVEVDYSAPQKERWKDLWIIQLDDDGLCFTFEEWPLKPPVE